MRRERGFGLVAAMFLIVVIAGVIVTMARLSVSSSATGVMALQQARAYQGARAGLEWGIYRAVNGGACNGTLSLDGFSVDITCSASASISVPEENRNVQFYEITATAQSGAAGTTDYAYRRLTATVEKP
ncbi:MAG: hypothetical protein ACKVLM_01700 [Pseudomonadales bacterium]|nr:hypothetical protein [Alphaproteobacteria bacterium]